MSPLRSNEIGHQTVVTFELIRDEVLIESKCVPLVFR